MPTTSDLLIAEINKTFGDGAAFAAKDMPPIVAIPSGPLSLDFAIGIGGVPANRVIEIFGPEGTGKTTLALLMARNVLDFYPDRLALFIDMEHKLTPAWMAKLVGDDRMDRIVVVNPDTIEQATEMYRQAVRKSIVCCAILDSIGGAPTAQNMDPDRSAEKAPSQGGNAQGVNMFARHASNLSAKYDCLTIGINQERDAMNPRFPHATRTPGGKGWKHHAVLRIKLSRGSEVYTTKLNGEDVQVGYDVKAQCVKNQLAAPYRTATYRFFNQDSDEYGPMGVDTVHECVRLSELTGVVTRGGSYYLHPAMPEDKHGKRRVNGKKALGDLFATDESFRMTVISEIMAALSGPDVDLSEVAPVEPAPPEDEDQDPGFVPKGRIGLGPVTVGEEA